MDFTIGKYLECFLSLLFCHYNICFCLIRTKKLNKSVAQQKAMNNFPVLNLTEIIIALKIADIFSKLECLFVRYSDN